MKSLPKITGNLGRGIGCGPLFFFAAFIFIIYYFSQIKREFILLEKVNPRWLAIALLAQFLTYYFSALVYLILLKGYRLKQLPRLWDLIKASAISLFFNQTMPSAGVSGNTYFISFLSRFKISMDNVVALIITELIIFYATMEVIILSLLVSCFFVVSTPHVFKAVLIGGSLVYLLFGTVIAFAGRKNVIDRVLKKLIKIKFLRKVIEKTNKRIGEQQIAIQELHLWSFIRRNKRMATNAFLVQLLVVAADGFTVYALFKGLGLSVSPFVVILCLICTKIISILPFLPGALILYESSLTFFFVSMGIPLGTSVIVTLIYRFFSFWIPIPVGFILYRRWLKKSPSVKESTHANRT